MKTTYSLSSWSLADLFTAQESSEMMAAFAELEAKATTFEHVREELTAEIAADSFLRLIQQYEQIIRLAYRIHAFAGLSFAADTQDQAAQTFLAQVEQKMAALENRTLFFSLWWKELDDKNSGRLMATSGDYRYWLAEMRHFKPHTLSEAEEIVVNLKNTSGAKALHNLYDSITNRYTFYLLLDGEVKELTRGELMVYVRGHDPNLRAAAYQEFYRIYSKDEPILGQIYQTLVRDWQNEQVDLRHFISPISSRNLSNDIPDEVVNTLLEVCQKNTHVFQRFFRLKARLLGIEPLRRYDIYAPVAKTDKSFEFNSATDIILESFAMFDTSLSSLARMVFDSNHLDSEVRKGKRSGAFCSTVEPALTPWVLVNYQGKPDDVATLAHELGHAIHSLFASHHSVFTQHASLPLAETASTFGEMMLIDSLLEQETDESVRRDLLFRQIDDSYASIMRQAYFALFERQAHALINKGATVEEISAAYLENLHSQFGDAVELSVEFRWEWVSIPHIYQVPFYVYAYTFGKLLVLSLYQQYKAEGETFKPRYLQILASGGSEAPVTILSRAGINVFDPSFWQSGFDYIDSLVNQLEVLTATEIHG